MKHLALGLVHFYQIIISPLLHSVTGMPHACRYPVTCSEYAKTQIQEKGVRKGGFLALKRVLSCHPFAKA